jgi:hypothetical protein
VRSACRAAVVLLFARHFFGHQQSQEVPIRPAFLLRPNGNLSVPLENLEMFERKGIVFPLCSSWGMLFPQLDHEGQTVGGPG